MKITIRQLNGCLSAMEACHAKMTNRMQLKNFISDMLEIKVYELELPDNDKFAIYITEMAKLHANFVKAQGENRKAIKIR